MQTIQSTVPELQNRSPKQNLRTNDDNKRQSHSSSSSNSSSSVSSRQKGKIKKNSPKKELSGKMDTQAKSDKDERKTKQMNKKKNNQRQRSRSPKKEKRSRSKSQRHRKKHRDSKHRRRDSKDRHEYRRSRSRDRKRNRDQKERRGRSREKDRDRRRQKQSKQTDRTKQQKVSQDAPKQIPMPPMQIPMPPIPGDKRRRQRSRSPLEYYRRNQSNNQGQFWDSFAWQPRINYTHNVSSTALANTKKMRRLMISNIPYQIGITQDDLRELITKFMGDNYLKDEVNNCPVVNLQMNQADRNVAVELSSVEETCRICKLDKIELFKGMTNGIVRLGDSMYGNNVVTQAQNAAIAQVAAFAAISQIQNKKTTFNLNNINLNLGPSSSTLIRVTNAVTPYMAEHLSSEQWQDYHEDLLEGFGQFGTIVHNWFVKKFDKAICADPGNLFVEFQTIQAAEAAFAEMNGRIYDERSIKLYYIPRQMYYLNYQKGMTPPTIISSAKPKVVQKPK